MRNVPNVTLALRERLEDGAAFDWVHQQTRDIFAQRCVVVFAVPGAFTPACSTTHLPEFEARYDELRALGVDEVYCLSVNDAFVMFQWAKALNISQVKMLPDGNGDFTHLMGMLVKRHQTGMGLRSWRYAMVVNNCKIEVILAEDGFRDDPEGVPVANSGAQSVVNYLVSHS